MPFVPVPKDLTKVKTKVALNLTKRQLICFSIAGAVGIPTYLFSRTAIGTDVEATIRGLKARLVGEIQVGGPGLARSLAEFGLIDAYRLYLHPVVLGRGTPFFAAPRLLKAAGLTAQRARKTFPACLAAMPMLLPSAPTALRPRIDAWLSEHGLAPVVAAEFDDSALLKAFGREGRGVFAAPAVLADEIAQQYQVQWLGTPDDLMEEFYAISVERRITHPAVAAITATARGKLFAARAG